MVVVNGIVKTTAESIAALTEAVAKMEQASRAEAGCFDYTFSVEMSDRATIRITERWDSEESLKAHFQEPHMADFQAAMGAHPPESMEVKFYKRGIQPLLEMVSQLQFIRVGL